ncbi:MAG: hypothetical protein JXA14_17280 [Anaerolineae bacterium]|nr:hypothetical protein [Anaerolineae bacterium]
MLQEQIVAALEHCPYNRVPVGKIDVNYSMTDKALGYETLREAKWRECQAYWQGCHDEAVTLQTGLVA